MPERPPLRLAAHRLHLDKSGDYTSGMPPVEQHHNICDELSARISMERKREVCPSQTEEVGHGHEQVSEDGQILTGQALFQR
jgi:hypothetical protein